MSNDNRGKGGRRGVHVYDPDRAYRIKRIMERNRVQYREKEHFFYVRCPFHGGKSLGFWFHKSGTFGSCWRCSHKANWNEYAKKAGLRKAYIEGVDTGKDDDSSYSLGLLKQALHGGSPESEEDSYATLPNGMKPWREPWRRLRGDFLARMGVFRWYDDTSKYERILWPMTGAGEIVGWQAGRADPRGRYGKNDPKYRASKPLPSREYLLGLDQLPMRIPVIVMVEGGYDWLRLLQNRIPAVANLGADSTWTDTKAETLLARSGLRYVLVAFDEDEKGNAGYEKVVDDLGDHLEVKRVRLPKIPRAKRKEGGATHHDCGSAPMGWVRDFREDVYDLDWSGRWFVRPLVREYGDYTFPSRVFKHAG